MARKEELNLGLEAERGQDSGGGSVPSKRKCSNNLVGRIFVNGIVTPRALGGSLRLLAANTVISRATSINARPTTGTIEVAQFPCVHCSALPDLRFYRILGKISGRRQANAEIPKEQGAETDIA